MFNRVKQVISALTASITLKDRELAAKYLTPDEQVLLWRMNLPDQRHVLNVAYSALKLAQGRADIDKNLLIKCALLHDVGKVKGDVSTLDKIFTVMVHKLAPQLAQRLGRHGKGNIIDNIRHAFFIYFNHPALSAAMLQKIGEDVKLINIVAKHHKAPEGNDPPELVILRQADDLN